MERAASSGGDRIHLTCKACGRLNRLPRTKLDRAGRCGACGARLQPERPQVATKASFDKLVLETDIPVLVDFWAPWCGPCRAVAPTLEALAQDYKGRLLVAKVNTEEQPELARQFNIRSIPTLALFKGGAEVDRALGALRRSQLDRFVGRQL